MECRGTEAASPPARWIPANFVVKHGSVECLAARQRQRLFNARRRPDYRASDVLQRRCYGHGNQRLVFDHEDAVSGQ
jgi:hypothetical protein